MSAFDRRNTSNMEEMLTKILFRITPAFTALMSIALWAVLERLMPITNVVEEMYLFLLREKCRSDAMHWRISPSFIVKATLLVEEVEELLVTLTSPEIKITDFKITPD